VREISPHFTSDRYWSDEIAALQAAILGGGVTAGDGFALS